MNRKLLFGLLGTMFPVLVAISVKAEPDDKKIATPVEKEFHSYILLDRTGSMESMWNEAVNSVNSYAEGVSTPDENEMEADRLKPLITLVAFDKNEGKMSFDLLRDGVLASKWTKLASDEVLPRGNTPLYDAIGKIVSLAQKDNAERSVIVIMTDGKENASSEYNGTTARKALDRIRAKGWQVVFLGTDFVNFADAKTVGIPKRQSMGIDRSRLGETMESFGQSNRAFGLGKKESIEFDEEDRAIADEEALKIRKGVQQPTH